MFSAAKRHTLDRVLKTPVRNDPFPHIIVEEAFPPAFYTELQRRMLPDACYKPLVETGRVAKKYSPQRLALFPEDLSAVDTAEDNKAFWSGLFSAYNDAEFINAWVKVFQAPVEDRLAAGEVPSFVNPGVVQLFSEIFLMRDLTNYSLRPHTDSPRKVVSVLFYLPGDDSLAQLGTSLYAPKEKGFTDAGGPHLPFERFDLVATMPYKPNTIVAFPKTTTCFHGVEPVRGADQRRDLMLFDIKFMEA